MLDRWTRSVHWTLLQIPLDSALIETFPRLTIIIIIIIIKITIVITIIIVTFPPCFHHQPCLPEQEFANHQKDIELSK